jgi:hypothetical protein
VGQDGEFIVDPSSAEDRAALVVDYFRRARAARRTSGPVGTIEDDWEIFQEDAGDDQITDWDEF